MDKDPDEIPIVDWLRKREVSHAEGQRQHAFNHPDVKARIAALESQLAQYRWRRVEDELPRMETDVLGYSPLGFAVVFLDDEERWRTSSNGGRTLIRPTRWMPLPPAPEEVE